MAGPWTLAATVERPRGDKCSADFGARRELAQALAEGLRGHVADVRRRVPGRASWCAGRRARARRRAGAQVPDGVRLRPAPHGAPARGVARRWRRSSRRSPTRAPSRGCTLLRAGTPLGLLADVGCARRLGRPRPLTAADLRRLGRGAGGRGDGRARRRTLADPAADADRTRRSPSGCSAGSTCSASTSTRSPIGSC